MDILNAVKAAEGANGGPRKSWPVSNVQKLRDNYERLLTTYPWLHGYWIRYARVEFRLGSVANARSIYQRALDGPLKYSAPLWTSYLQFLVETNYEDVARYFEIAKQLIGHQFLSHEFWRLYIQWKERQNEDVVEPLLYILLNTNIHQFAVFYGQLVRLAREAPLKHFSGLLTEEPAFGLEETNENRTALLANLMKLLRAQQKRVADAYVFEKRIHEQFFNPLRQPLAESEVTAWKNAIGSAQDPQSVYQRALIPAALNTNLWLNYARWLIANKPETAAATLQLAPSALVEVKLYLALWLEFQNCLEEARDIYQSLASKGSAHAIVEFARFLKRQSEDPVSVLERALKTKLDDPTLVVSELSNYSPTAFQDYSRIADSPHFWQAYLRARPDLADEIYEEAPEGSITDAYLELLAQTDVAKYIELDRQINRSAL